MKSEEIRALLYEKYIRPTRERTEKSIGIEIEMPVVNLSGPADYDAARAAAGGMMERFGFRGQQFDREGNCYSATEPESGDNLSFDCSYNNLELSFGKERDLRVIDGRFREYVRDLQDRLGKSGHTLTGMGVNPHWDVNRCDFIPAERYRMLERYLSHGRDWREKMYFHPYVAFGAFASASQVQLDVAEKDLIDVLHGFSLLEPLKAVLFHNGYLSAEPELLCARDMFWENSTHGINPHNIGMYERVPETVEELIDYIASTSIFCTERAGRYICFRPIPITKYLEMETVTGEALGERGYEAVTFRPEPGDLKYLRTYKFEDLTWRGTIEFRSVCCQPFRDAMSVAAFHMGLMARPGALRALLEEDRVIYHRGYSAGELRKMFNRREWPEFVDRRALRALLIRVLELAEDGLKGTHAEEYLAPLYRRAETLRCPAREMLERMEQGTALEEIILDYGALA